MTKKQFEKHECEPTYKRTETLLASAIIDLTCRGENQKLLVKSFDGIEYLVKVQKPTAIPLIIASRRKVTPFKTDDKETAPFYWWFTGVCSVARKKLYPPYIYYK